MDTLNVIFAGLYNSLYAAALIVAFYVAWRDGIRRGWPKELWLLLLAFCITGGIAGSKLLHFDFLPHVHGAKTILGGVLGGTIALALARWYLRFNWDVFDPLAIAIPLGHAIGRIGCFQAGCCFGVPSSLPWAVRYTPGTPAYSSQLSDGLISQGATTTLPIHPTQLYEVGLNILLAVALWSLRDKFKKPGSAFLAYCAGYGLIRFSVEFFRAGGGIEVLGLKAIQWSVGAAVIGVVALLVRNELSGCSSPGVDVVESRLARESQERRTLILLGIIVLAILTGGEWFTPLERVVVMAISLSGLMVFAFHRSRQAGLLAAPGVAVALIMIQPVPGVIDTIGYPRSYNTLGASGVYGKYWEEDCDGNRSYHLFRTCGVSYSHHYLPKDYRDFSFHARIYRGIDEEFGAGSEPIEGFSLKAQADWHYIGLGLGALNDSEWELQPVANLRLGSLSEVFIEGRFFDHEPAPVPEPVLQVGLGVGIPGGSRVRSGWCANSGSLGLSFGGSDMKSGWYAGGTFVLNQRIELSPYYARWDKNYQILSMACRIRFGVRRHYPRRW